MSAPAISFASRSSARLCAAATPAGSFEVAGSRIDERPERAAPFAGVMVHAASIAAPSSSDESNCGGGSFSRPFLTQPLLRVPAWTTPMERARRTIKTPCLRPLGVLCV